MYNKYIGNSGRFIRVEDHPGSGAREASRPAASSAVSQTAAPLPVHHQAGLDPPIHDTSPPARTEPKSKPLLGGLGSGLSNLLSGRGTGGLGNLLGGFGNGLKGLTGVFDHLPFGLDIGDILLFLLLLFFFLESGDEEFIIILGVIAFSLFKER